MEISETTTHCMSFRPKFPAPRSTNELNYRVRWIRDFMVMRDLERRASMITWLASLNGKQALEPTLVATHSKLIVKALVSFPAKFWWVAIKLRI